MPNWSLQSRSDREMRSEFRMFIDFRTDQTATYLQLVHVTIDNPNLFS